ncbi:unnamed protein product [Porites evermanni]|uniref:BHLH domain-containing protein n=1 Tax=Porites evermanni TaxID=104178 RepID=A0ABN8LGA8_9CNID|nr:unnamed protein product [Porites evermanni]
MSVKEITKSSAFTIPTTTICYPHQRTEEAGSDVLRPPAKLSLLSPVLGQTRRRRAATSAKQKEPAVVARRNARERKRVKLVNDGFMRLRKHVPTDPKNKKLSKVKTLRSAIDYIRHLQHVLAMANKHQIETEQEAAGTAQNQSWMTAADFVIRRTSLRSCASTPLNLTSPEEEYKTEFGKTVFACGQPRVPTSF